MKRVGAIKTVNQVNDYVSGAIPSSPHADSKVIEVASLKYPTPLSTYTEPPLCEVTLEEFEELALGRLERTKIYIVCVTYIMCSFEGN